MDQDEQAETEARIAIASHELRAPLAAIRGFAEILRDQKKLPTATRREALDLIISETGRLARLVDDVLDHARLGADGATLQTAPVCLAGIARAAAAAARPLFAARGSMLELSLSADLPAIEGDADRLHQVTTNLLANAAGFARTRVVLSVAAVAGGQSLVVEDDGPGIQEADRVAIFRPFHASRARRRKGTGLGLAIARMIVTAHGGTIIADAAAAGGARLAVSLPG